MSYYCELEFFKNPLRENFVFPAGDGELEKVDQSVPSFWNYTGKQAEQVINPEIISWAKYAGLTVSYLHIFVTPPNTKTFIHTDSKQIDYHDPAINWVVSGIESDMIWYKPMSQYLDRTECIIGTEFYFNRYDESKMEEVERHRLTKPTLVHINIPHRVDNYSNETRVAVSIRFTNIFKNWDEMIEFFDSRINR